MSAPQRLLCSLSSRTFLLLPFSHPYRTLASPPSPFSLIPMPRNQRRGQQWKEKPKREGELSAAAGGGATTSGSAETEGDLEPKSYGTASGVATAEAEMAGKGAADAAAAAGAEAVVASPKTSGSPSLSKLFSANLLEKFTVDNNTYSQAQIRATFYPKFENEKSDQEIRIRMIEMVSKGLATLEVSLKHSGSLFMYAGHEGGAYAKNSFGNIYTAVGVFVLGRMFREAWGAAASKKQAEFNDFLERNHMCISMELVTAVLGDHGQRPEKIMVHGSLFSPVSGVEKAMKFSTEVKSASSFFAAYDALCEEGTATPVCKALDEIADISVPGSKDHIKAQGEILEGLVARLVSHDSPNHMKKILKEYPFPPADGDALDLGPSLREICAANRSDENRNADRSAVSKFLQTNPADYSTKSCSQEVVRLMREKRFPAAFKCYHNFHKVDDISSDNLFYKMVIHVHSDSAFRRYQKEMRHKPGLWPLYRGFFVDINLFKANKERTTEISKNNSTSENGSDSSEKEELADEDANLMVKLKFLTYKLRTFLIRNGLSILFKEGPGAYKAYYLRAVFIRRKCGNKQLSSSTYLSEAEPFLEQFGRRSPLNQALIGSAGNLVRTEDFLAIVEEGQDEEGDLAAERESVSPGPSIPVQDTVPKADGLIVFFPGIPGCAKSALCKELLKAKEGLGDERPCIVSWVI
ncbi:uncharacterized protein DS421_3g61530 [Arachis hypogaea]|nr:uncharacterized protein DS421_3g61530 [Arachis hypogaea]